MRNLKFLLTGALAVLCLQGMTARELSADEAVARFRADAPGRAASINPARMNLIATGVTVEGKKAYYAFASDDRTLFLSADDVAVPLLGYTDESLTDMNNVPPALRWWLDGYARQISWASKAQRSARPGVKMAKRQKTEAPQKASRRDIPKIVKTNWDQDAPYNDQCPMLNGSRTYTGCVATAMAQAMYYYQWPAAGKGSNSYTWENGNNQTLSGSMAVTFDWNNMLPDYSKATATTAQKNAISTLMKAVGYSINMNYGGDNEGGSGAVSGDMIPALLDNFNYDAATSYYWRDHFDDETWTQMLYDNLLNVGPVIYGGTGSAGGHCFICDGYSSSDGFFHMNWGWSGVSDGFFSLDALDPDALGAGGGGGGFNYGQDAIIGMRRPVAGSVRQKPYLSIEGYLNGTTSGRKVSLNANGPAEAGFGFMNISALEGTFDIAVSLKNNSTGATSYVTVLSGQTLSSFQGYDELNVNIPTSIGNGTYTLTPVYRIQGESAWTPFKYWVKDGVGSVTLTVSGNKLTITGGIEIVDPEEVYVVLVDQNPVYETGKTYSINTTIINDHTREMTVTLYAALGQDDPDNPSALEVLDAARGTDVKFTVPASSEGTPVVFNITIPDNWTPGEYYLCFVYDTPLVFGINNYDNYKVTIVKGSGTSDEGDPSNVYVQTDVEEVTIGTTNSIAATVVNGDTKPVTLEMFAALIDDNNTIISGAEGPNVKTTVPGSGSKNVSFSLPVASTVAEGEYYLAFVYDNGTDLMIMNEGDNWVNAVKKNVPTGAINVTSGISSGKVFFSAISTNKEWTENGAVSRNIVVEGTGLTGAITATLDSDIASDFTITPESLPAAGGTFTIRYVPTVAPDGVRPNMTLSAGNAEDVTIVLIPSWDGSAGGNPTPVDPSGDVDDNITADKLKEVWRKSAGQDWVPASATTQTRDIAYGDGKLYVLNMKSWAAFTSPNGLFIVDPYTGNKVKDVNTDGVTGGTFKLASICYFDGKLIGATGVTATQAARIYVWNSDDAAPAIIELGNGFAGLQAGRIAAEGTWADGKIWITGTKDNVLIWYPVTNGTIGTTGTKVELKTADGSAVAGSNNDAFGMGGVTFNGDGTMWVNGYESAPVLYKEDGTFVANAPAGANNTYGAEFRQFTFGNKKYAAAVGFASSNTNGKLDLVNITDGLDNAVAIASLPEAGLGATGNGQRISSVKVANDRDNNGTVDIWVNVPFQGIAHYSYAGSKDSSSLTEVDVAEDAVVEYYNLQGIRVDADVLTPGLYIRRQGSKATKILVR